MNYFMENSINAPARCGWIKCKNSPEPGSGRCEMHQRADKNAKIAKLTPKQRLVYDAIKEYPEAANDDAILLAAVWHKEGWHQPLDLEDNLKRVSRPETLSRRRRELFNLGLIEYSPKAMKSRMDAFKNERERHSPIPPFVVTKGNTTYIQEYCNYDKTGRAKTPQVDRFVEQGMVEYDKTGRARTPSYEQQRLV